jgi:hypothetical protein
MKQKNYFWRSKDQAQGSRTPSEFSGSAADTDSLRYRSLFLFLKKKKITTLYSIYDSFDIELELCIIKLELS